MKIQSLLFVSLLLTIFSNAQPGTLDKQFGNNGIFLKQIPFNGDIYGSAFQSDGKPLAVGNAGLDFSVFRFTADGLPDQGFGDSGLALVHFPTFDQSIATAVACQSNNRILVAGYGWVGYFESIYTGIIVRLNNDGSVDSSFGQNGTIQISTTGEGGYGSMAVQPDNSFVVIGYAGKSEFLNRFTENGQLDETFGQNGYTNLITNDSYAYQTVKIEPDGKIIIGGSYSPLSSGIPRFFLQRYLANGSIDKSFGQNGTVITEYERNGSTIYDLGFQSDGKIIAFGFCDLTGNVDYNYATARYLVNGTLDSSFGIDGKSTIVFDNLVSSGRSVAVMANDQLIVGGAVANNAVPFSADYGVARLNADGSLDSTFGGNGETITDLGKSDYINGIFLQENNKIVAIGESDTLGAFYCSVARYNNDATKKQIIITKIKHWVQHHNGIEWDNNNISSYVVQRSYDGIHWATVHSQQTIVNSQRSAVNYYEDAAPLIGTNYYRVQTTSTGNAIVNSNVIAISNDDIRVSPNPAINSLQIQGLSSTLKTKLTAVDFTGNIKMQVVVNSNSYNLNIAALKAGNYLLKIETNNDVITKKFVKE